jgi:Uracil DNA glycosylase superfamily
VTKPPACSTCPYKASTGFVEDWVPDHPKIAIVMKMPSRDDLIKGIPASGKMGWYLWKDFLTPLGLGRDDVLLANVVRCFPNGGEFPIGKMRKEAIKHCGQWDQGIKEWGPTVMGISFSPAALMRSSQQTRFLERAIERAVDYSCAGEKPLLLLGEEAKEKYAPWLNGGLKTWQGTWFAIQKV